MKSLLRLGGIALTCAAFASLATAPAQARDRHHGGGHRGGTGGAAVAAGIVGLAVGAAIGSQSRDRYYDRGYYDQGYSRQNYNQPVYYNGGYDNYYRPDYYNGGYDSYYQPRGYEQHRYVYRDRHNNRAPRYREHRRSRHH